MDAELHRRHTLSTPRGLCGRIALRLFNGLEKFVSRVSVHGDPVVYDIAAFPWVLPMHAQWRRMRVELDRVLAYRERLPNFQDILKQVRTIQTDDRWKTYWLVGVGMDCRENAARCPDTMRVLRYVPGLKNAFFSVLSPGKHVPAHRGAYNGLLRLHLALKVPEPAERCRIRIGSRIQHWTEGEALIFDDTYQHEVWNDTGGERVVLFVDFARPLRQPWHWLNEHALDAAALAPFLREANAANLRWMKTFRNEHTRS